MAMGQEQSKATDMVPWKQAIAAAEKKFNEIAMADGNVVNYQREAMFAMQIIGSKEILQNCDHTSIRNAVVNVASVGLTLNPAMKLAYLVPRDGLCCLDISYIGLTKIATDSGSVQAVKAEPVYTHDKFSYNGPFAMPTHTFDPFASRDSRGEVIGAYVLAKLATGMMVETLSREEIDKIRSMSKAKSGPWFQWFDEMVKKSAIKRASKMWPRTERLSQAEAVLNEHEGLADAEIPDVERIEMPRAKSAPIDVTPTKEVDTSAAKNGVQAENTDGAAQQNKTGVALNASMLKVVRAMAKNKGITEAEICAHFKAESLEALTVGVNDVLGWIANPGA
jgi:recombination protein RecT